MTVKNIISQLEKTFGRQSESYIIQIINDGLLDIANKKQSYVVSSITDLEQKIEFIETDIENEKVSKVEGNKLITEYRNKIAQLS